MSEIRLIDANALAVSDTAKLIDQYLYCQCNLTVKLAADLMPTIEAEPIRYAQWVNGTYCSNCQRFPVDVSVPISNQELTKYFSRCPHCGARMGRGE